MEIHILVQADYLAAYKIRFQRLLVPLGCLLGETVYTVFLREDVHLDMRVELGCEVEFGIVVWEGEIVQDIEVS